MGNRYLLDSKAGVSDEAMLLKIKGRSSFGQAEKVRPTLSLAAHHLFHQTDNLRRLVHYFSGQALHLPHA